MRCFGDKPGQELYALYHDTEWGVPVHDDRRHFEMLILEGAQAGLSWETILKKREGYRVAFCQFDPVRVAAMTDEELVALMGNPSIVRNRLKIFSARKNARVFLQIQAEFGSFDAYVWRFVGGIPLVTRSASLQQLPCRSVESDALSSDLRKRGMNFVGTKIMYSFMQAVGLLDDHLAGCIKIQSRLQRD
jgi:DNA-3-methyladenine glycosylase I